MPGTEAEALPDRPAPGKRLPRVHAGLSRSNKTNKHRNGVPLNRSQRAHLELPVLVYGHRPDEEPLREVTHTLVVYARGALLNLDAAVEPGDELVLVNTKTEAEAACRVVALDRSINGGKCAVKVEFTVPTPNFWGVTFPPEDWDPAERKLPRPPRLFPRVKCSQTVRVCPADDSLGDFTDVCSTENISRDSIYFPSERFDYRKGMRLVITFLSQSDFFSPNSHSTGIVVRVDQGIDGHVGVAVKLFGLTK